MHDEYTVLMSLVLDREAEPAEVDRLSMHLRSCRTCAETWQQWRSLDRHFAAPPLLSAPAGFVNQVIGRLEGAELRRRRARWVSLGLLAGWLAVIVVSVLWGGLVLTWFAAHETWVASLATAAARWVSMLLLLGRAVGLTLGSLGAPTLAGAFGLLACATCALGMTWLLLVSRRSRYALDVTPASAR